jgi:hypothetical protein
VNSHAVQMKSKLTVFAVGEGHGAPSLLLRSLDDIRGRKLGKWRVRGSIARQGPQPAKVEDTTAATRRRPAQLTTTIPTVLMSTPLLDVWEAASSSPFYPTVGKNQQFTFGILLLFLCKWECSELGRAINANGVQPSFSAPSSV